MRVRLEKKQMKLGETIDVPDHSYNHYYNFVNHDTAEVYYLVPETIEDAQKAMAPKSQKESP